MPVKLPSVFEKIVQNPRKLFLVDGTGALLTALLLSLLLASLEQFFGMPKTVLYALASVAFLFGVFSFSRSLSGTRNWRRALGFIRTANILYCCLTIGLVIFYNEQVSIWGILYFLGEIVVILLLVFLEQQAIQHLKKHEALER
jgi:O-antigen/teichoic acid export membrane protein